MDKQTWSYTSITEFQQCAKKYYHLRILKETDTDNTRDYRMYGYEIHKAAEDYIKDDVEIPENHAYLKEALEHLKKLPGEKFCEYKIGLTADFKPTGFFKNDVWWRGAIDLLIVDGEEARLVDYKTGKPRYADTKQLEISALAVFKHFPQVQRIKAGLLFVVHPEFIKETYTRNEEPRLWMRWIQATDRLENAIRNNVWNPNPNFLCRAHCPVLSCWHNGRNK